ncbi:MAG TPA: hypothetical protein VFG80_11915 [Myxococcota bacterium]|nr:hypothetical protein [Myxococcota bacterium]
MPLFILAGGELVLLFLGARIAWWVLRTREGDAPAASGRAPTGGGASVRSLRPTAGASAGAESLREAA